ANPILKSGPARRLACSTTAVLPSPASPITKSAPPCPSTRTLRNRRAVAAVTASRSHTARADYTQAPGACVTKKAQVSGTLSGATPTRISRGDARRAAAHRRQHRHATWMETAGMELAPGVHSIGQEKGGQVRCFLLDDGGALTLIDTLWDVDAHRILDEIKRIGRTLTDLKHVVLTHGHRSHLGGLATLKRMSRALVYCHAWEADIVQGE